MQKNTFLFLIVILISLISSSCDHKQEKSEINRYLTDAANYCIRTETTSPTKVYNYSNFSQLCAMSDFPVNFASAKYFRASEAYNNSSIAANILDGTARIADSIEASELMQIIIDARSNLLTAKENFAIAKANYYTIDYDYYINIAMDANNRAVQCIEHAQEILYQ